MPVYEYVCRKCGHEFEELVFGSEQPSCPQCRSALLEKKFSTFGTLADTCGFPEVGPRACGDCGNPRGPGACGMNMN